MMRRYGVSERGVVLREMIAVAGVLGVSACVLLVGASESRRSAGLAGDKNKLRWHAEMTDAYAGAHDDRYWTFSEPRVGDTSAEAIEIINRLSGRAEPIDVPRNWLPHVTYSNLALADWLGLQIPDERFISSGDEFLLTWASDPEHYDQLGIPAPDSEGTPYKSSFVQPPAFWSYPWSGDLAVQSATQSHKLYYVSHNTQLGGRRTSEVEFPSHKVFLHDQHDRHFSSRLPTNPTRTQLFFGYEGARIPILFADGSVRVTRSGNTNIGWVPSAPRSPSGSRYLYRPAEWDPITASGEEYDIVRAWYRYTRGGLRGLDIGPQSTEGLDPSSPGPRNLRR